MATKRKAIGMTIMLISVIGFIVSNNAKNGYEIFTERFSEEKMHQTEVFIKSHHDYQFYFWGVDEEFQSEYGFPDFEAEIKIFDKNNNILFDTIFIEKLSVDAGGVLRAENGFYYYYSAYRSQSLKVIIKIISGDYLDLEVHEDLPDNVSLTPQLYIFVFIVGLIVFLTKKKKK